MANINISHFNWLKIIKDDRELTPYAKYIAFYLSSFMNMERQMAWPSQTKMAGEMRLGLSTIKKHLNILIAAGYLVKTKSRDLHKNNNWEYNVYEPDIPRNVVQGFIENTQNHSHLTATVSNPQPPSDQTVATSRPIRSHEATTNKQYNKQYNKQEPEDRPSSEKKKQPIGIKQYIEQCKTKGVKPIPEEDKVFEYSESVNIPTEWLYLCWLEFVEKHLETKKRQKNWPQAFRNCVRDNWYRFWWMSDEGMILTSQGKIAQTRHKGSI